MAQGHYENFPVASLLLPAHLRRPVALIYAFARTADDFADEGNVEPSIRLAQLDSFRKELSCIEHGAPPQSRLFQDLCTIIVRHHLPVDAFYDLLDAFSQDVIKQRYANYPEVLDYCRRSADPVGRLLLVLYDAATAQNIEYSNAICSSLQLINFLQDIALDYRKGRIYLPQDELRQFGVSEDQIRNGDASGNWAALMRFQIERTRCLLYSGAPLGKILSGRVGLEMRMIIAGGATILDKLEQTKGDIFRSRPVLKSWDWGFMFLRALLA